MSEKLQGFRDSLIGLYRVGKISLSRHATTNSDNVDTHHNASIEGNGGGLLVVPVCMSTGRCAGGCVTYWFY